MHCPRDKTGLVCVTDAKSEMHTCPECHGVWLSNRALRQSLTRRKKGDGRLVNLPEGQFAFVPSPDKWCAACPATRLSICGIAGIEVDSCPKCQGVWLDQGELQQLLRWHEEDKPSLRPSGTFHIMEGVVDVAVHGPELVGEVIAALADLIVEGVTSAT